MGLDVLIVQLNCLTIVVLRVGQIGVVLISLGQLVINGAQVVVRIGVPRIVGNSLLETRDRPVVVTDFEEPFSLQVIAVGGKIAARAEKQHESRNENENVPCCGIS